MNNRIAQMHEAWRQLELLKSNRQPTPKKNPTEELKKVPPPSFCNAASPLLPQVSKRSVPPTAEAFSGKVILAEPEALGCDEPVAHTPPKLKAGTIPILSSSSIDLPELPVATAQDSEPTTRPSSTVSSPRAGEPGNCPGASNAQRLRRMVSNKLTKVADEVSDIVQKISPVSRRGSPQKSSDSAPSSPRRADPIASLSVQLRNQAAKAIKNIRCQAEFQSSSEKERQQAVYEALDTVLQGFGVTAEESLLDALFEDTRIRNRNAVIKLDIDLQSAPHAAHAAEGAKKFENSWKNDTTNLPKELDAMSSLDKEKTLKLFKPTFLADFYRDGVQHKILQKDGSLKAVKSPLDVADFLDQGGKNADFCLHVSNYLSQNLMIYLQQLTCGGLPGIVSPVRLYDGTPITPAGRAEYHFAYAMDSSGELVVDVELKQYANNGNNPRRASKVHGEQDARPSVYIDQDAVLSIKTSLKFAGSGADPETSMGRITLLAEGWNYSDDF